MSDKEVGRVDPALVNHAPSGHGPSGFDPARGDIPQCKECGKPSPNGDPCEDCAEVARLLSMTDEEVIASSSPEDVAWSEGVVEGIKIGMMLAEARVKRASDSGRLPEGEKPQALSAEQARAAPEEGHRPTSISQSERVSRLEEALKPFAREADRIDPEGCDSIGDSCEVWQVGGYDQTRSRITYGDLRRARSALNQGADDGR